MASKKILFVTGDQSRPGGTERACADVANMLENDSFNVEILSFQNGLNSYFELNNQVKLHSLGLNEKGAKLLVKAPLRLNSYLRSNHYDYVVIVESMLFLFTCLYALSKPKKTKLINWEHFCLDVDLGVKSRNIARWLAAKFADINIVLTLTDKQKWQKRFNLSDSKVSQIYNLNPYAKFSQPLKVKKRFSKLILACGRLTSQKGFDQLINAWAMIPARCRDGWTLKIVGEGVERKFLENLVSEKGFQASILLPGLTDDMVREYQAAELFILSSRYEGFGLVLTEALSFSTPVIAFECPAGPSEIIIDKQNGLLVECGNVEALSLSIQNFIVDDGLRSHLTKNAQMGLERFTEIEVLPKWLEILK
jgi:glycosyltransferase involved in cell wall biosynthesis